MSPVAIRTLEVLENHVSPINARSVFRRALDAAGFTPETMSTRELTVLLPALSRSVRLFVDAPVLARIMSSLSELAEARPATTVEKIPIADEDDVSKARLTARSLCRDAATPSLQAQKIATAVSELARNLFRYATGGVIELEITASPPRFIVRALDRGPGINNLPEILSGRYKSRTGMGLGLLGTKRMVDEFDVVTGSTGTRIVAVVHL